MLLANHILYEIIYISLQARQLAMAAAVPWQSCHGNRSSAISPLVEALTLVLIRLMHVCAGVEDVCAGSKVGSEGISSPLLPSFSSSSFICYLAITPVSLSPFRCSGAIIAVCPFPVL